MNRTSTLHRLFVVVILAMASLTVAAPAQADVQLCEQWGSAIQDKYVVQNNRWGTSATQCIETTGSGFRIVRADGSVPTNGPPKSYPSIFIGCHYTNCSPGSPLPAQISTIGRLNSSISYTYTGDSIYNASYDIWLDPTPKRDGVNKTEIMIWFNRVGPIQPIGRPVGTATVGGRSWEIWTGNNGGNDVISFVAPAAIGSWSFDVMDFVDQAISHGLANASWYLTSVQAGFEPWQNGTGLAVNSFSAAVENGSENPPPTCKVAYTTNTWSGGFTADVTISPTSPVNGWSLAFTLPPGQTITNAWNATVTPATGAVTARPVDHNASIPPNGSRSFGFQGTYTGAFTRPTTFTLNGTPCTVT
ncbi:GH12 family glycosyl hydrolase domain-containing protein [Actinomadura rudentiformis]|nr:cellulose binding domain-containing protein [Actinomadura rudentiformis]